MRLERTRWNGTEARAEAARLRSAAPQTAGVEEEVAAIVAEVRAGGDEAVRSLTARLDATAIEAGRLDLRVDPDEIARAANAVGPELVGALEVAARNIQNVARVELEAGDDARAELPQGQAVSVLWRAVRSAGIYAPGGRAAYPSSVLMGCVPARVAGVSRIAVASPPGPDGSVHPATLAACAVAGVDQVYAVGGAQAIAAFAFGTDSIERVDVIAGPGNRYVNEAKRLVFGDAGVDGVAGPSELVVVLDAAADARAAALDLLAQGEHGDDGLLVAISPDGPALEALAAALEELVPGRPTVAEITVQLVEVPDLGAAIELADEIAPEHLELALDVADVRLASDRLAGCVFFGPSGAVAFGDYAAGSNHVLPTGGGARFGGPLGVGAFRRRTAVIEVSEEAAAGLAPRVAALARAEGFDVHAESVEARGAKG